MRSLKYIFAAFAVMIFIGACQKELDFQDDGISHGTLKSNGSGDCLPSTINGIFKEDSLLNNNNFIDVQVSLTVIGTYDIKSDTVNGYSFHSTGSFDSLGINTVRLFASGKPLAPGVNSFTIKFDSSTCIIDVTVVNAGTGPATYSLAGTPGACSGALSNGSYLQGTPLDINNTVTMSVDVTAIGTYTINATAVNGMLFSSTGIFTTTGSHSVTLNGTGTPLAAGIFNLTASNGPSTCTFSITVLPAGGGGISIFTLDVTGTDCSGATSSGTYDAGTALTSSNVVLINVTVVTPGTYTITTNTNDGITFSGSGTFAAAGSQPVTITGSGTPLNGGVFNFTAASGASNCTFSITVTGTPANEDYIPQTDFSNWSARVIGGAANDTAYTQVSPNTIVINTNTYKIFEVKDAGVAFDSTFHRKNGGMYYEIYDGDYGFDNNFNTDGLVLDSSLATNATWTVDLGSNTFGGIPATGKVTCTIIEKGATAIIAGNNYINIIKVKYIFSYDAGSGDVDSFQVEIWYAKGKGVIYQKVNDIPVTSTDELETTRIQIF